MLILRPRASRMAPSETDAMPLPSEETTPPVTNTNRLMDHRRSMHFRSLTISDLIHRPKGSCWKSTGVQSTRSARGRQSKRAHLAPRALNTRAVPARAAPASARERSLQARRVLPAAHEAGRVGRDAQVRVVPQIADRDERSVRIHERQRIAHPGHDPPCLTQLARAARAPAARDPQPLVAFTAAHLEREAQARRIEPAERLLEAQASESVRQLERSTCGTARSTRPRRGGYRPRAQRGGVLEGRPGERLLESGWAGGGEKQPVAIAAQRVLLPGHRGHLVRAGREHLPQCLAQARARGQTHPRGGDPLPQRMQLLELIEPPQRLEAQRLTVARAADDRSGLR